jgi:hypothetical protein
MIVLDTNVISELMRSEPERCVVDWLDAQAADQIAITAVTVGELLYGVARLPDGKRKQRLHQLAMTLVEEHFAEAVLAYDVRAAQIYSALVARSESKGRAVSIADTQIAAICIEHEALLATRNCKDFEHLGVQLINPWQAT